MKEVSEDGEGSSVSETFVDPIALRKMPRNPAMSMLQRRDVQKMLEKIRSNDPSTIVFKVKEHVFSDINTVVFDAIVDALAVNKVCQSIYIQNLSSAIHDDQVRHLLRVLKKKKIWNVNIGENYEVSLKMWEEFCNTLPDTFVTHLYVSEHVIPLPLKNLMRDYIRSNRKKHNLHCSFKNLHVIERCTNMWWNPINGVKELKPYVAPPKPEPEPEESNDNSRELLLKHRANNPNDVLYWQEGVGKGGEKAWKFKCPCGEECSSYENSRYHPIGRMFECSICHIWSHVECVFKGKKVSDDDLEEMEEVLCRPCQNRYRRNRKRPLEEETTEETTGETINSEDTLSAKESESIQQSPSPSDSSSNQKKQKEENIC